uniref:Uncharacterized protein n=1 Tax=Trichuris muris TaxID=70415 RepID=A0A5S6QPN7_TRIMR
MKGSYSYKKLVTFKNNFARGELRQFPKLFEINEEAKFMTKTLKYIMTTCSYCMKSSPIVSRILWHGSPCLDH